MPKNNDVLSATTDFGLFFCNANFFQFDHISVDSFCFPFRESNLECPAIRTDYSNISTGKACLDSYEGQMEAGLTCLRKEDLSPHPCSVSVMTNPLVTTSA